MSKEKQIEEMCEVLRQNAHSCQNCSWRSEGLCIGNCELAEENTMVCEHLYNAGYRKQSEVARDIINQLEDVSNFNEETRMVSIPLDKFNEIANKYIERGFFLRMTHTCPHCIPNLIPIIEEMKGGAEE